MAASFASLIIEKARSHPAFFRAVQRLKLAFRTVPARVFLSACFHVSLWTGCLSKLMGLILSVSPENMAVSRRKLV